MSNFNLETFFPSGSKNIIAGPEVVNGTGQVSLKFCDGDDMVFFLMDCNEVLGLADWLAKHAFEAERQQWRERHILSG
jgi:hypothetical protein